MPSRPGNGSLLGAVRMENGSPFAKARPPDFNLLGRIRVLIFPSSNQHVRKWQRIRDWLQLEFQRTQIKRESVNHTDLMSTG